MPLFFVRFLVNIEKRTLNTKQWISMVMIKIYLIPSRIRRACSSYSVARHPDVPDDKVIIFLILIVPLRCRCHLISLLPQEDAPECAGYFILPWHQIVILAPWTIKVKLGRDRADQAALSFYRDRYGVFGTVYYQNLIALARIYRDIAFTDSCFGQLFLPSIKIPVLIFLSPFCLDLVQGIIKFNIAQRRRASDHRK